MAPQYCTMACAARAMPALTAKWSAVRPSRATAVTSVHSPTGERRGRQMSTVCRQPESTAWCSAVNPAASVLLRDTPRCIRLFTCSTGSGHYITCHSTAPPAACICDRALHRAVASLSAASVLCNGTPRCISLCQPVSAAVPVVGILAAAQPGAVSRPYEQVHLCPGIARQRPCSPIYLTSATTSSVSRGACPGHGAGNGVARAAADAIETSTKWFASEVFGRHRVPTQWICKQGVRAHRPAALPLGGGGT